MVMLFDDTKLSRKKPTKNQLITEKYVIYGIHAITHYTLADFPFSRNSTPFSQNDTHSTPRFSRRKTVFTCRITAPRDNHLSYRVFKNPETITVFGVFFMP